MASDQQLMIRLARLQGRLQQLADAAMPAEDRVGQDYLQNKEDLATCKQFMLEVYHQGKTETVWAAEHPREYERVQKIAGVVPTEPVQMQKTG